MTNNIINQLAKQYLNMTEQEIQDATWDEIESRIKERNKTDSLKRERTSFPIDDLSEARRQWEQIEV